MIVCDHEDGLTYQVIGEALTGNTRSLDLIETGHPQVFISECCTCGAKVQAILTFDIIHKGKSRKTNRLWALLKGVK